MNKKFLLSAGLIFIILLGCNKEEHTPHMETEMYEVFEGQLAAYHGNDTELYLPETVTQLSKASFQNSLSSIESIHIGRNVNDISWDTFANMPFLSSVYVDEENAFFCPTDMGNI